MRAFETLQEEITNLKMRAALSDEDMGHLREIYKIDFALWYDPDNDACEKYGRELHPHIAALNAKFQFKR